MMPSRLYSHQAHITISMSSSMNRQLVMDADFFPLTCSCGLVVQSTFVVAKCMLKTSFTGFPFENQTAGKVQTAAGDGRFNPLIDLMLA